MRLGEECRVCLFSSQTKRVQTYSNKTKVNEFINKIDNLCKNFPSTGASPLLMRAINEVHKEVFSYPLDYSKEKIIYNSLCLSYEDKIQNLINSSLDPLKKAIQFARVGNLIDFAKLTIIEVDLLEYFIKQAEVQDVDEKVLTNLKKELQTKKEVVYLLDNCGEIVFDKILIKVIKNLYPHINIISVVRGKEIINDVTYIDSQMAGLDQICKVIDNGTDIPGTSLDDISKECLETIKKADIIISKGLGNFETLHGCKLNIYYMFLCKCMYFANKFNLKQWESVLTNEHLLND